MQNEHGIAEDFEQYDDEKEFRRLVRAVRFSKKHFLYFACCNQVPKQNELIAGVKKELKGKKIKVVKFKKRITDLLAELQKQKFDAECEAVFVQGLEYSISSDGKGDENALIYNLNISRDSFKKYFSCPLFLWLPEYALVKITRHAPDFFSVRSGTFYFSSTAEQVTEQIFQSFSSGWIETTSLPIAEKIKKIETLESLLAEYRGLHQDKRNKQTELNLLYELASFFNSTSKNRKAIEYYKESLLISRETGDRDSEGSILNSMGNAYLGLGEYEKAIEYFKQALIISREIGNQKGEGSTLNNLGLAYTNLGEHHEAIKYHKQSLEIKREPGNRFSEGSILNSLGLDYYILGECRKAIEYHEQALKISCEIGDQFGKDRSLGNLGNAYYVLGEYRKAIEYYEEALEVSRAIGDRFGEGQSLGNLGLGYKSLGEKEKACDLLKEAIDVLEAIESPHTNFYRQIFKENCES